MTHPEVCAAPVWTPKYIKVLLSVWVLNACRCCVMESMIFVYSMAATLDFLQTILRLNDEELSLLKWLKDYIDITMFLRLTWLTA